MLQRSLTANPVMAWLDASEWWVFLRREMAPTAERWEATMRLTLACLICTVPVMIFHLKQPAVMIIAIFLVAREDLSTTLLGTILAIGAATVGWGMLMVYYLCALDLVWFRVLCVPAFIGIGLLMIRVVNPPILGLAIAIYVGFGLTIPDTVSNIETLNRTPTYYWWAWTLGLSVNLTVQYLMNPHTSHSLLARGLISRLEAVEAMLRGMAAGQKASPPRSSIAALAFSGAAEQLRILKVAGAVDSLLKKRQSEITAQIILVDRLVTAASMLEIQGIKPNSVAMNKRLLRLAEVCAAWRRAIRQHQPIDLFAGLVERSHDPSDTEAVPPLDEMERVVELWRLVASGRNLPDEIKLPRHQKSGFLAGDAFTNPEHLRYAAKGMLAATICYLTFTLFAYPGIYTCVITCVVCSLSTVGASVQRSLLRFTGAAVGGAFGFISLMYILPHLDSLVGFWFPFSAVIALAAYVTSGSIRISYCGVQIAFAFSKCVFQSYGTYTELRVCRDRLIGIAFGLLVFGFINSRLWPVSALDTMRAKLAHVFRQLARLASLPDEVKNAALQATEGYNLRLRIYQDFISVDEMRETSKFERGGQNRDSLVALEDEAKSVFIRLLAINQHRPDLRPDSVPEPLRDASLRLRTTLADALENIFDRVQGKPERPWPSFEAEWAEMEKVGAREINNVTDASVAAQLRGRLALYRGIIPVIVRLELVPN